MAVRRKPKQTRKPKRNASGKKFDPDRWPERKKPSGPFVGDEYGTIVVPVTELVLSLQRIADATEHVADQMTELVSSVGEIETGQAVLFEQGEASGKMQRKLVTQLQALAKTHTERTDMFDRAAAAVAQHLAEIASNG